MEIRRTKSRGNFSLITGLFAKLSLQLCLRSCERQIHHFHCHHIWQGLLSRPHYTPWNTRLIIVLQSLIPLSTPCDSMQFGLTPSRTTFPHSCLWKEQNYMYIMKVESLFVLHIVVRFWQYLWEIGGEKYPYYFFYNIFVKKSSPLFFASWKHNDAKFYHAC